MQPGVRTRPRAAAGPMPRLTRAAWWIGGILLLGIFLLLSGISDRFVYGSDMTQRPIIPLVGLAMAAGAVYLALWFAVWRRATPAIARGLGAWIVLVGLGMRLALFPSLPMLEDDYHRYLWDGAVLAEGHNPYRHIPAAVQNAESSVPAAIIGLGAASGLVLERVNHPQLGTVYPPVAEAVFALAYRIRPWSLVALKAIYLAFDGVAVMLIALLLRRKHRPRAWIAIYWWNPLFILQTYNGVHMDILLVPFLLGALWLHATDRPARALAALAVAAAVKLWPVMLAPLFLWPLRRRPRVALRAAAVFGLACLSLLAPLAVALAFGRDSGFVAYGQRWEMNDALYMIVPWATGKVAGIFGEVPTFATRHLIGRAVVIGVVATVLAWVLRRQAPGERWLAGSALAVTAAIFLVSPTQFPWYFGWMLPMLALHPRVALMLLTMMLPLYYLKFYFDARGQVTFFHYRVVWFEHVPIWIAILLEGWRDQRGRPAWPRPGGDD